MPATTFDTQAAFNALWGDPVFYTRAATGEEFSFTACVYEKGESEGLTSYGVYGIRKELATFALDALDGSRPSLRDQLFVDDDEAITRVVTSVEGSKWLKFWKVELSYPAVAADLDQLATVERANAASDALGLREPHPIAVYTDIPCRLQPDKRVRELDSAARVVTEKSFVCVFGQAVVLEAGDTVTVDSVVYEVTEQSEIESLGLLTFAAVSRVD